MNYCTKHNELCELANAFGYCTGSSIACIKSAKWNNTHSENIPNTITTNIPNNLTTELKRDDGIYIQLFAVKNGVRYDMKVVNLKDVTTTLTGSLMDGIEKLCK